MKSCPEISKNAEILLHFMGNYEDSNGRCLGYDAVMIACPLSISDAREAYRELVRVGFVEEVPRGTGPVQGFYK